MIAPLLEGTCLRFGALPQDLWGDAYLLGFLAMLASLEAQRVVGSLGSHALGLVQSEALAALSGDLASVHGEDICLFSMDENPDFEKGCRQACFFHQVWTKAAFGDAPADSQVIFLDRQDTPDELEIRGLWAQMFETHFASLM